MKPGELGADRLISICSIISWRETYIYILRTWYLHARSFASLRGWHTPPATLAQEINHKKGVHLGRTRLPTSETPATGFTLLPCAREQQCARSNLCAVCPVHLALLSWAREEAMYSIEPVCFVYHTRSFCPVHSSHCCDRKAFVSAYCPAHSSL